MAEPVRWCSGEEIARMFVVSRARLASYAARGNLQARRSPSGEWRYSVENAARLFRRRGIQGAPLPEQELGTLGIARLGYAAEDSD